MAIRRPIVWNPSLRIYEQLQLADGLDVGDIQLSLSYVDSPIIDTTIDLNGFDVTLVSNGNNVIKLIADDGQLQLGNNVKQVSGTNYKHSFFKSLTTTTATPTTFVHQKTTSCLIITGKCYARNVSNAQDNVFDINCLVVGDSSITPIASSDESIIPLVQQTAGLSLTFGVVSDVITFNVVGHPTNTINWNFDFTITEIGQP